MIPAAVIRRRVLRKRERGEQEGMSQKRSSIPDASRVPRGFGGREEGSPLSGHVVVDDK